MLRVNAPEADMETAAIDAAVKSGFRTSIGSSVFHAPPTSGAHTADNAVEVTLSEAVPRIFTAMFFNDTVPMSGRAVAVIGDARPACILALDPSADGAVTLSGTADAVLENCDIAANSVSPTAVDIQGSADLDTDCIAAVGGVSISGSANVSLNECNKPAENTHEFTDPYAGTPEPALTAPCEAQNSFGGSPGSVYDIGPGRYCGGMDIRRTVNLDPGVYIIDGGGLDINSSAVVRGSGVTFYLTNNADISINGSADIQVSAPTSGAYSGIVVFADRDNDSSIQYKINGNSDSFFSGAVYAPSGMIVMNGSSTSGGGCTQLVGRLVKVNGGTGFGSDCSASGTSPLWSVRKITLVE